MIDLIRTLTEVDYVERNCQNAIDEPYYDTQTASAAEGDLGSASRVVVLQKNATWNLVRISQRNRLTDQDTIYKYEKDSGLGVDVYVIDS